MFLDPRLAGQGLLDPPFGHLHATLQRDDARLKRVDLLTNALEVFHSCRQTVDLDLEAGSAAPGLVQGGLDARQFVRMAFERDEQRLQRLALVLHVFEQTFDLSGDGGLRVAPGHQLPEQVHMFTCPLSPQ
jgi:hypothetical protein